MIELPRGLLPKDGRFGSGPSKIRPEALSALCNRGTPYLGTSHRQPAVREVIARVRDGLAAFFSLPQDYEVVLGNGGATAFFDVATFCCIVERSQHCTFGEFSSKFATAAAAAPHLGEPSVIASDQGTHPEPVADTGIDTYALTHNETSTGVTMPVRRPRFGDGTVAAGCVVVDATSAAGGIPVDPEEFDVYFFAPQKAFGSEGGLWLALLSPAAIERTSALGATGRFVPASLDLALAIESSRLNQTYNTPALVTLALLAEQIEWFNAEGGLAFAAGRSHCSSQILYSWAERSDYATPFVQKPDERSPVVATIDLEPAVSAAKVAATLRRNGILDTEPYRRLGRNQLRVACFPGIEPSDVEALTSCIDYVVERLD